VFVLAIAGKGYVAIVSNRVRLSVCMCVWLHVCVCARERGREGVCLRVCVCVCVCVCVWVYVPARKRTFWHSYQSSASDEKTSAQESNRY